MHNNSPSSVVNQVYNPLACMVKPFMASPSSANVSDHESLKYKGVRKRNWGKWVSEIRLPNSRERIWLGSYDSAEKAARAFDAALFCLRGERANFNFPDTPFLFHLPHDHHQSLTHPQIKLLASSFAKQFHHHDPPPPEPPHHHEEPSSAEFHSSPGSVSETGSSTCTSSPSCVQVEVDHGDDSSMDWSFLNSLDYYNDLGAVDCGLYSELDYFQFGESTSELSLTSPAVLFDYNAQENHYDAYSHNSSSFLWNFGYEDS